MASQSTFERIKQVLITSQIFDVDVDGEKLVVRRRRKFAPRRGAFRLLLPHSLTVISAKKQLGSKPNYFVRPDSLAIFMVVVSIGAIIVEIFMDRAIYPREYPPAFVYGFSTIYISGLIFELTHTRKLLEQLFDQLK